MSIWFGMAVLVAMSDVYVRIGIAAAFFLLALLFSAQRMMRMLRRARWLLLAICGMGLFLTPGEFLPGVPGDWGITYEGLRIVGGQTGLILALLSSLSLLHERLGNQGILAALFALLQPLPNRSVTIVRLMLVIEWVERDEVHWRDWILEDQNKVVEVTSLRMQVHALQARDLFVMVGGFLILLGLAWQL